MEIISYNSENWIKRVEKRNQMKLPVTQKDIEDAKEKKEVFNLTPQKTVPYNWYGDVKGKKVLCLMCNGGRQAVLFSALGADVMVLSSNIESVVLDKEVSEKYNLFVSTVFGSLKDLCRIKEESFDMVFLSASNIYVENQQPIINECFRILKKGGILLSGYTNPKTFIFMDESKTSECDEKSSIPYFSLVTKKIEEVEKELEKDERNGESDSLDEIFKKQFSAGFEIKEYYNDNSGRDLLDKYIESYVAIKAEKPIE